MGSQPSAIKKKGAEFYLTVFSDNFVIIEGQINKWNHQKWTLEEIDNTQVFYIKHNDTGLYLDIDRENTVEDYPSIVVAKKNKDRPSQKWKTDGETIGNNNLYVTVLDDTEEDDVRVIAHTKYSGESSYVGSQQFVLVPV